MTQRTAIIPTPHASKYLQQLCKHFGHKVPVEFTPEQGQITLPFGACDLSADETQLILTVGGEADSLDRIQDVIGDHLKRFAFRENIKLNWQAEAEA